MQAGTSMRTRPMRCQSSFVQPITVQFVMGLKSHPGDLTDSYIFWCERRATGGRTKSKDVGGRREAPFAHQLLKEQVKPL